MLLLLLLLFVVEESRETISNANRAFDVAGGRLIIVRGEKILAETD